jgi:predicted DNA-binding transcriptional regulator YafY
MRPESALFVIDDEKEGHEEDNEGNSERDHLAEAHEFVDQLDSRAVIASQKSLHEQLVRERKHEGHQQTDNREYGRYFQKHQVHSLFRSQFALAQDPQFYAGGSNLNKGDIAQNRLR